MKKSWFICILVFASFLPQPHLSQTPQPTPTPVSEEETEIKVSTTLIQIDVVVTDKKGKQVTDLSLGDFEIYENGEKQEIQNLTYVSSKSTGKSDSSTPDTLNLQGDEGGLSLKEKIKIPTIPVESNPNAKRRTFVIVVDDLGLNFESVNHVKKSLTKFIKEQLKPGDLATIVTTSGARVLPAFTSDTKQLLAIVKKLKWSPQSRGGAGSYEPIRNTLLEELSESRGEDLPGTSAETSLLEDTERSRNNNSAVGTLGALTYIVNGMRGLPGRKALVLFSEGFSLDERSTQDSIGSDGESKSPLPSAPAPMNNRFGSGVSGAMETLVETANRSSVVIYTLDPRGLDYLGMAFSDDDIRKTFGRNFRPGQTADKKSNREDYFRQTQHGLRVLATETGGFAILNQNDLEKGLDRITDDQSYYLLSYITSVEKVSSLSDAIDKVEIKVKKPDFEVRYRNSFYSPNSSNEDSSIAQTPREKVGQALAFPFRSNEIKLNLYSITGNSGSGDFVRFLINISARDLDFEKEKGSRKANFDILAITLNADGKPVNQFVKNFTVTVNEPTYKRMLDTGVVYVLPVVLRKSGIYHFRVAVRDSKTGKVGAASKFLETPKFEKKRLWISNLTLRSVYSKNAERFASENDSRVFTDTTLREFAAPVTLHYGVVVYNAKSKNGTPPQLKVQTRLIRDDKVVLETPLESVSLDGQEDLQRIGLTGKVSIKKSLPPGNYIFQITLVDELANKKTQIATQWIDFEVLDK